MREILFKAKRIDNGEWVYGCLVSIEASNIKTTDEKTTQKVYCITNPYIPFEITVNDADNLDLALYRVVPETICQYTGLTDKNGKKIWENDIVSDDGKEVGCVVEHRGSWFVWGEDADVYEEFLSNLCMKNFSSDRGSFIRAEVLGNIFDHPELMKGEEHDSPVKN